MRIEVVPNESFDAIAANEIAKQFSEAPRNVCFATGNTPIGVYADLVQRYESGEIDPRHVRAFTLDEYAGIPATHPNACFHRLNEDLYRPMKFPPENLFTFDDKVPAAEAARRYEEVITSHGGLHLSILGIGLNGHVGFNEPGMNPLSRAHVVQLADMTIQAALQSGWNEVPHHGMTLGIATLMDSSEVLILANGIHKADIVAKVVHGPVSQNIPASLFRDHPNCLLLLDEDAARLLQRHSLSVDHK